MKETIILSHALPLTAWPVDRRVGNVRSNDAGLIEPIAFDPPMSVLKQARLG